MSLQERLDVVRKAGLRPADFAQLVGVSRATVSFWFRGMSVPKSPAIAQRVETTLNKFDKWVSAGKLPVEKPRKEVVAKIKQVLS